MPKAWICRFSALVGSPFLREMLVGDENDMGPTGKCRNYLYVIYVFSLMDTSESAVLMI